MSFVTSALQIPWRDHKSMGNPELEGIHRESWIQLLALHRTPKSHPVHPWVSRCSCTGPQILPCAPLGAMSKCSWSFGVVPIPWGPAQCPKTLWGKNFEPFPVIQPIPLPFPAHLDWIPLFSEQNSWTLGCDSSMSWGAAQVSRCSPWTCDPARTHPGLFVITWPCDPARTHQGL